jgi:hypothetical protein
MKAKLDFDNKTIELECEATLEQIDKFAKSLKNWKEWRIITPVLTVSVPSIWITPQEQYPQGAWYPSQPTWITTTGGSGTLQ